MKKYLIFSIWIFCVCSNSFAQSFFDKKILQPNWGASISKIDGNGNIYIGGYDINNKAILLKLDSAGNLIWDKVIGFPNLFYYPSDLLILPNQNVVLSGIVHDGTNGRQIQLVCIDSSGNLVYSKLLGDSLTEDYFPYNMIGDSLGFIAGYDLPINAEIKLIKFDFNGNIISEVLTANGYIYERPDGNYILYSRAGAGFQYLSHDFTTTYIQEGNNVAYLIDRIIRMVTDLDGNTYAIGTHITSGLIGKLNDTLQLEWMKFFSANAMSVAFTDMFQLSDKSWIIIGDAFIDGTFSTNTLLIRTDSLFNPVRTSLIETNGWSSHLNFFSAPDHFVIVSSSDTNNVAFYPNNIEVIKTDTTLTGICALSDTSVSVTTLSYLDSMIIVLPVSLTTTIFSDDSIPVTDLNPYYGSCDDSTVSVLETETPVQFQIFPNPASSEVTVYSKQPALLPEGAARYSIKQISIYNMLGKKFLSISNSDDVKEQLTIDVSDIPSGIYFIKVTTEKGTSVQKFIKQ